ncbi:MAG: hypothetical protein KKB21_05430 [Nanoarchaeota archaeon]|nr:hypothetical protein [Nanoarchaeota archaeon]MBU4086988.1 hypothetical protein [Nanoarchaeota archaeon]
MANKNNKKLIISIAIIIGIVILFTAIYFGLRSLGNAILDPASADSLAKCLSEKNVKMYGAYWCPHCSNQKNLFGGELEKSGIYVECAEGGENPQPNLCYEKGIDGYPTWEINGKLYSGELSLSKISSLSGCEVAK